jgi:subtilisin family serine protease
VEYAEPNYRVSIDNLPDDPLRGDLWGLFNVGQQGGTPDADIDGPEAWDLQTDASQVLVGIIDTGIDYTHADLAANLWTNPGEIAGNGVDDDGNGIIDDVHGANFVGTGPPTGNPMDDNGHGTHTAGTVGAAGNNGLGVTGVSWNARLMAVKCFNSGGNGTTADVVEAVQYAASFGARVTNNSYSFSTRSRAVDDAIAASGALFVAAAGNDGSSRRVYPAGSGLPNIIAVAATTRSDVLAGFSNYGTWVHLAAPGLDIMSTVPGGYGLKSGTSMATPHVAGAAALTMARFPGETVAQVRTRLLGGIDLIPSLAGRVSTGGRLNVFRALGGVPSGPSDTMPPTAIADLGSGASPAADAVTLAWSATGDDGPVGQAVLYDLRHHSEPITEANWALATQVSGEPLPAVSGQPETFTVTGLEASTTYHFALKALDDAGNSSALSNVFSATTAPPLPGSWASELVSATGGGTVGVDFHDGPGQFSIGAAYAVGDTVVVSLFNGTQWSAEVVDPATTYGAAISFAFAPDGTPTVSYGYTKIMFARRMAGGTWKLENVEKGSASNDYTSLAYDPATGEPTIAYRKGSNLRFARKQGGLSGTWIAETVDVAVARYQDMVYDQAGNPVIAYSDDPDGDNWLSSFKVARKSGGVWSVRVLHEGQVGYGAMASIAAAPDGALIAADANSTSGITVFRYDGVNWSAGESVGPARYIRLEFMGTASPFTPYISLNDDGGTFVDFFDQGSQTWVREPVEKNNAVYARNDIRRDPAGGLGLLYGLTNGGIKLARK